MWVTEFAFASPPRLGAIAIFMFLTGARIGEALSLRWKDTDLAKRSALIRQAKTQTTRSANLPPELIVALANLPGERRPDARVFGFRNRNTVKTHWDQAVARAGIERLTPHCCRHGFATGLLQAGVDVVTVAKLGGWRSPAQVLATYGHASEDRTLTDRLTQNEHTGGSKSQKYIGG
jgi:integrase